MTPILAIRIAAYLLALDGVAALVLAGIVGPTGAGLTAASIVASLAGGRLTARLGAVPGLAPAVVAAAAVVAVVDLLYLAPTVLDGLVHLLLFLVVARLFALRGTGDARIVAFLAFFMLVAASSASFGVSFLFVFLGYLLATTWLLLLQHLVGESEPAPARVVLGGGIPGGSGRGLFLLAVAAAAATLAITAVLFFVIPRVGLAALPFRGRMGTMVTGFAESVELGSYGEIQTDETVAMRVHIPEGVAAPDEIPDLRWRGIAFDEFDGQIWRVGQPERITLRRVGPGPGDFRLASPRPQGRPLYQQVFLEPLGTDVIFAAARVLRVTLRSETLTVDDMGSLTVASASARLSYVVESDLGDAPLTFPVRGGRGPDPASDPAFARYLALPRLPARIGELARQATAGSRNPYDASARLAEFLAREYRYTLSLERRTALDPVDEFLFVRRSGNCEYFAAAHAVMLRTLGIPSRLVRGFQRGEWNPYGRYFTVRMKDAHAWVEAYIAGAGWVTLDPTPRADEQGGGVAGALSLYLDALRMRWYRYVVNWSLRDQVEAATTIRRQAVSWRLSLRSLPDWRGLPGWALPAAALAAAGGAAWLWSARRSGPAARAAPRMPGFYARALRLLARRGLAPAPNETAREFARRVAEASPARAAPFAAVTDAYERARFGAVVLTEEEVARVGAEVGALARSVGPGDERRAPPQGPSPRGG